MSEESFRFGRKCFIDNIHFPRGFRKSGDFTLAESELLSLYGDTLLTLESGELEPANSEERHFVAILPHPYKARTRLEQVWFKYIKLIREPRKFHSLNSCHSYKIPVDIIQQSNVRHDEGNQADANI